MDDSILITSVLGVVNILTGDSVLIQCDLGMVSVLRIDYLLVRYSGCDEHPQVCYCSHRAFRAKVLWVWRTPSFPILFSLCF